MDFLLNLLARIVIALSITIGLFCVALCLVAMAYIMMLPIFLCGFFGSWKPLLLYVVVIFVIAFVEPDQFSF